MEWGSLAEKLIVGIAIAVVTAFLTVKLALRRFYAEKWWERKFDTYTKIIEALHHIKNHVDHNHYFAMLGKDLPKEGEEELRAKMITATGEIRKQADIGTFIISSESLSALHILKEELEGATKTTDWFEHLELKLAAVNKCLEAIQRTAKVDLKR